jgi:hypothetical protein
MSRLRRAAAILALLLTAGCARLGTDTIAPISEKGPAAVAPDRSLVIIGVAMRNPVAGPLWTNIGVHTRWMEFDPETRSRLGTMQVAARIGCAAAYPDPGCNGATQYFAYDLPPGSYTLAWVDHAAGYDYSPARFAYVIRTESRGSVDDRIFSKRAEARPEAPRFDARAGEVVYVGDVVFDFADKQRLKWAPALSEDGARRVAARLGVADRLVTRPWRRTDGGPAEAGGIEKAVMKNAMPGR